MSDTNDDKPNDNKPNDSRHDAGTAEAEKSDGTEPSLQQHHDPETDADTSSGGAAD